MREAAPSTPTFPKKKHCILLQKKKLYQQQFHTLSFFLPMEELRITVRKKGTNNKKKRKSYVKVKKKKIVVVCVCDVLNNETKKKVTGTFF